MFILWLGVRTEGEVLMANDKWVSFKPISYIGFGLILLSIVFPYMTSFKNDHLKWFRLLLGIVGIYLIFRGRKEHQA